MLSGLHALVSRLATWPVLALVVVLALLCNAGFEARRKALDACVEGSPLRKGCERAETLDPRAGGYSRGEVQRLLDLLGERGRRIYALTEVSLDLVFPFVYGLLFAILLVRLYTARHAWVLLLPIAGMTFDLLENLTVATLAWTHREGQESTLATAASAFTVTKSALLLLSLLLVSLGVVRGLRGNGA